MKFPNIPAYKILVAIISQKGKKKQMLRPERRVGTHIYNVRRRNTAFLQAGLHCATTQEKGIHLIPHLSTRTEKDIQGVSQL
jgi:hypothetical protein